MLERISIILLLNILFFLKTLGYKYSSDDIPVHQRTPKDLKFWKKTYLQLEGSIRVTPIQDHFITTMIHAFTAAFVYTAFGANDISFLAAVLFSVNPINNQGSVWIAGRGYALPTLFMLAALTLPLISPIFLLLAGYYNIGFFSMILLAGSPHWYIALFIPVVWWFHHKRILFFVKDKVSKEMFVEDKKIKPEKLILAIKTFCQLRTLSIIHSYRVQPETR
jgi:hypothetical protein